MHKMLKKTYEKYSNFKFDNKFFTLDGKKRAYVDFNNLTTLWFNTGTLCNIECKNCYIKSSPKNDYLEYISFKEVNKYLDQLKKYPETKNIGFTGGEPFMNPEIIFMLNDSLSRGYDVLILTNAMRPLMRHKASLLDLNKRFTNKLTIRVSLDHYKPVVHNKHRGANSFEKTIEGLNWLNKNNFNIKVASRIFNNETEKQVREGFKNLFKLYDIDINSNLSENLVVFSEMFENNDVSEISDECWGKVQLSPKDLMCSNSRMVVKKKSSQEANIQACTLIAYKNEFNLGKDLTTAEKRVYLNHHFCSQFCVLGNSKCI